MWVMKNLALGSFILFYASFAILCFASGLVLDHDLHTENTKVVSGHNHITQPILLSAVMQLKITVS